MRGLNGDNIVGMTVAITIGAIVGGLIIMGILIHQNTVEKHQIMVDAGCSQEQRLGGHGYIWACPE